MFEILLAPLGVFLLTLLILNGMVKRAAYLPQDHPNARSLHTTPVPRTGGLAVMAGWLFAGVLIPEARSVLAFSGVLMAVSFLDDWRGLSVVARFAAHFVVAAIFFWIFFPALPWWGVVTGVVAVVWMTNLYNFMDGSDGLAGGMGFFGFGFYGLAAAIAGNFEFAAMNFALAAACAAFLCFNFHPARIFLGDAGSIPLGFLSAAIGVVGWRKELWPLWFPALAFSPFIADASVTLLRRLLRGDKIWQAHREHYYQRLVRMGWGHRNTALLEYGVMFACGLTGVLVMHASFVVQAAFLFGWAATYILLAVFIDRGWSTKAISGK